MHHLSPLLTPHLLFFCLLACTHNSDGAAKSRRNMMSGNGSPRPPSPPRGSPTGGSIPGGEGAPSSDHNNGPVPRLNVGQNGKHAPSSAPSPSPSKSGGKGEGNNGDGDGDESSSERIESLTEELEDARGDLQLTISDLRVILEATPAFVCAVDPHGHVSGWNTAAIEITGLRRDAVLQRHFVEHFVPQQYQQPAADAMEAAFSLPADDPLAGEPGEPFDLTLWRGGVGEASKQTVKIRVRAYARRLAGGQPVGLLLIQDDAASNDSMRERTNVERRYRTCRVSSRCGSRYVMQQQRQQQQHAQQGQQQHAQQRQQQRTRSGIQHLPVLACLTHPSPFTPYTHRSWRSTRRSSPRCGRSCRHSTRRPPRRTGVRSPSRSAKGRSTCSRRAAVLALYPGVGSAWRGARRTR